MNAKTLLAALLLLPLTACDVFAGVARPGHLNPADLDRPELPPLPEACWIKPTGETNC
jgi:hypothetical protein